jgi:thiamine pyrophosphate-dependent acetolactate synthase large subunit-like protein
MFGFEVIQSLASLLSGEEIIVSSNGNISRQVYHYCKQPQVYLRGSMGLTISVGLGLALARPDKQVVTILGDGNFLMGLSSLATLASVNPSNIKILILDNQAYATTGNQGTTSGVLNYTSLLDGFGLQMTRPVQEDASAQQVEEQIKNWLDKPTLIFLPIIVKSKPPILQNIPLHPEEIASLQQTHLSEDS